MLVMLLTTSLMFRPPRLHYLSPAEGEQLSGKRRGPFGGLGDLLGGPQLPTR